MKVLVTGGAGKVAQTLIKRADPKLGLSFVTMDVVQAYNPGGLVIIGSVLDFDAVLTAAQGCDAIVHLTHGNAAGSYDKIEAEGKTPLESVDFIGAYNVFEAAAKLKIKRVVYASRAGVVGGWAPDSPHSATTTRTIATRTVPTSWYTLSKVFGEGLGYMYAAKYGISVVCVRIGNFNPDRPDPTHPHHLGHTDCAAIFCSALTADLAVQSDPVGPVRFEIVWGVSGSSWPLYDTADAKRAIGHSPSQRSEIPASEWKQNAKL